MKLIAGLGNPGEKYQNNRHNAGFMMLDYIAEQAKSEKLKVKSYSEKFKVDKISASEIYEFELDKEKFLLMKPQTFMNDSGRAVKKAISNQQLTISSDLYIIHDDLDIRLGEYKIQKGKGPKLHNGIESIEQHLHTKEFWRVRIGVDNRPVENRIPGEAYVLQNFTEEEKKVLQDIFSQIDLINLIPN